MAVESPGITANEQLYASFSRSIQVFDVIAPVVKLAVNRFKCFFKCSKCSGQVFLIYRLIEDLFKQLAVCGIAV